MLMRGCEVKHRVVLLWTIALAFAIHAVLALVQADHLAAVGPVLLTIAYGGLALYSRENLTSAPLFVLYIMASWRHRRLSWSL
jgi:hypothetical protein